MTRLLIVAVVVVKLFQMAWSSVKRTGGSSSDGRRRRCGYVVDLSVFRSVVFNYFCLHTMLLYVSYDVPYIYGPARAVSHGMSHGHASFLVSIIGISSTVGQVRAICHLLRLMLK